jgi:HEAT repeat protein/diketogulonate reductase-like aldo/keto reductase
MTAESTPGRLQPGPAQPEQAQIDLLDPEGWRRRQAVVEIADTDAGRYALRSALCFDPDAGVRAAAAQRLAALGAPAAWLREAACDALPLVREAAIRALARLRDQGAAPLLGRACTSEPVWWVRRAAVLALAAIAGRAAVAVLQKVLDDPFWRVRHAAVQALAALGDEHGDVRAALTADSGNAPAAAAALAYLRRHWREGAGGDALPPPTASRPGERTGARGAGSAGGAGFWDDDPAVMTARLEDGRTRVSDAVLIELLADSHEPLRKLAARRLREQGDVRAFAAAAIWLDEPRIPYAAETARDLLDRLGDVARELAQEVLEPRPDGAVHGPGAVAWALGWIAATRCADLRAAVARHLGAADARVRAAAVHALAALGPESWDGADGPEDPDVPGVHVVWRRLLDDGDEDVRLAAVQALAGQTDPALRALLDHVSYAAQPAPARRLLAATAAEDAGRDQVSGAVRARLRDALRDPDAQARAHALAALDRMDDLDAAERELARRDPDPWIRMAVLDAGSALAALAGEAASSRPGAAPGEPAIDSPVDSAMDAALDASVEVQRAALAWLVRHRRVLAPAERARAAQCAAASPDPWQRTRACALLDAGQARELAALLRLSRDRQPMVRAAAADGLEGCADLAARVEALLDTAEARADADLRRAGYTWLLRGLDAVAAVRLQRALADAAEPESVKEHLLAMAAAFPAEVMRAAGIARPARPGKAPRPAREPAQRAAVARRPLGSTGIAIAPLAISGVGGLSPAALRQAHAAGVDLFFWEPHHAALTRFLRESPRRRAGLAIAAGSYHASPAAIEADVDTALRRLRTDHLDVFLLFWVRSPARLSQQAFACLERLKAAGKIRAAGFSTHHRDIACEAISTAAWDVVMVRHSAAHPGAEDAFLPLAATRGVGVLTFSALCYGRLLEASPGADGPDGCAGRAPPSAADCYRYSLSQPGVTACISAPQRYRELVENVAVLDAPMLGPEALEELRAHGRRVHARSRDFNELVRRVPAVAAGAETEKAEQADQADQADQIQALLDHAGREPRPLS